MRPRRMAAENAHPHQAAPSLSARFNEAAANGRGKLAGSAAWIW